MALVEDAEKLPKTVGAITEEVGSPVDGPPPDGMDSDRLDEAGAEMFSEGNDGGESEEGLVGPSCEAG